MTNPFTTALARQPRGLVKINGLPMPGAWVEFEVENNSYFSADTFSVKLSCRALDAIAAQAAQNQSQAAIQQCTFVMDTAGVLASQDMYVELFIAPDASSGAPQFQSWIYGQVDEMHFDPAENIITLSGRDLTRLFIDTKTTQKWPNLTSSQIATQIARAHGLGTSGIVATKTKAGKFYEIDHATVTDERSEWDLLNYLASNEGFVVFVRGTNLYFQPNPTPQNTTPYSLVWTPPSNTQGYASANFQDIKMARALTVSRGIQVALRSWNAKQSKGFVVRYPTSAKTIAVGKSQIGAGSQIYSKTIPNKTPDELLKIAQSWYQQLVAHEMKIDVTMPGDNALDTTSIISLSGTGTAFDQTYYPDSIHRRLTLTGGYEMSVTAKNHSPESQVGII